MCLLIAIVYIIEHVDIKMQTEGVNDIQSFNLNTSDIERITDQRLGIIKEAKINIDKVQFKQKQNYDTCRIHANPKAYQVGAKVLKKDFTRKKRKGGKMDYSS